MTREVNSNEIDSNFMARETQDKEALQLQARNNLQANSHNCRHSIKFTYGEFPCHFILNRDKIVLAYCWWKC